MVGDVLFATDNCAPRALFTGLCVLSIKLENRFGLIAGCVIIP
jgi:hypothetical protein